MNLADIRTDYHRGHLRRGDLLPDPIAQFSRWMDEAVQAKIVDPTALSLATVGADGLPRVRTVLLKGLDASGFVFYTNFDSRKGRQLGGSAAVSLLFPWLALERQVLVAGRAEKVSAEESARYFSSRPRESQLSAWTSRQSQPVPSREALEGELAAIKERFGDGEIPLPPFWGGYRVRPVAIEFWQGGSARLHDRFEYTRQGDGDEWTMERLSP